jgi:hypothetical protein
MAGKYQKRVCVFGRGVFFDYGVIGEREAEQVISAMCAEGCPACKGAMLRMGRFKCSCSSCRVGLELVPGGSDKN